MVVGETDPQALLEEKDVLQSNEGVDANLDAQWQRTLLIAIPFGALAFIIGFLLEGPSNQVSRFDLFSYPVMAVALIALEVILAFSYRMLRFVVLGIVAGAGSFFFGKLVFLLFFASESLHPQIQMTETFYWIPVIYLLSFMVPGIRGGRFAATFFTAIVLFVSFLFALLHLGDSKVWGMIYALAELNLANSVLLALTFAFINLKEGYTRAHTRMETIERFADTDLLTGLPNRRMFEREFESLLTTARQDKSHLAILFIDIDRFKIINDTLGHDAGDQLLKQVAERLHKIVRDVDMVARLSGDEFVLITRGIGDRHDVSLIAQRVFSALALPFIVKQNDLTITASIGVSIFPNDGLDTRTLLRHADSAMYKVKRGGKNGMRYYREETDGELERRRELERDLRVALREQQLYLHYQPLFDLQSGEMVKVEALVRWHHPRYGTISPAEFIPLAEESGLIVSVGTWILQEACRQVRAWQEFATSRFKVSVNVSLLQFSQPTFFDVVVQSLRKAGLDAEYLELELTESLVMNRVEDVSITLRNLQQLGIGIAIDDFGTGYSSLAYLRDLPIDTVKIDRSFIMDLGRPLDSPQFAMALIEAILGLANHLDLQVVAEGVETREQRDLLRDLGCHVGQGYWFARPMPAEEFEMSLRPSPTYRRDTAARSIN